MKRTAHLHFRSEEACEPNAVCLVELILTEPFEPSRLVVEPSCAPYFDVESLDFAQRIRAISGPIAATYFPPLPVPCTDHPECQLDWEMGRRCKRFTDEAWAGWLAIAKTSWVGGRFLPNTPARLTARNTSAEPHKFDAVLWGVAGTTAPPW